MAFWCECRAQSPRISELVGALGVITYISCVFAYLHSDPFALILQIKLSEDNLILAFPTYGGWA